MKKQLVFRLEVFLDFGMCVDIWGARCVEICVGMCFEIFVEMGAEMCVAMCVDMCVNKPKY